MNIHIDDMRDLLAKAREKTEEDELTAEEAIDYIDRELNILELESA
jgi:hypothetical protein